MLPRDWRKEKRLTFIQAAKRMGCCRQRLYDLVNLGQKLPSGSRVKLESVFLWGRRFTSVQAIDRFVERCNPATADPLPERTATEARRASEAAAERVRARLGRGKAKV